MPCRCDDYEPSTYKAAPDFQPTLQHKKELEHEHTLRCKSQSLAHKLGRLLEKNNISIPAPIKKSLDEARSLLATHKRGELAKDNKSVANEINAMKRHINKIEELGGIVPESMQKKLKDKQTAYKTATGVSDAALLGD
jgi:SUMO ligase MMS21 Smc5/6 complex component